MFFPLSILVHTSFHQWWHHKQSDSVPDWGKQVDKTNKTDILLTNAKTLQGWKGSTQHLYSTDAERSKTEFQKQRGSVPVQHRQGSITDQLETKPQPERISHRGERSSQPQARHTHTQRAFSFLPYTFVSSQEPPAERRRDWNLLHLYHWSNHHKLH